MLRYRQVGTAEPTSVVRMGHELDIRWTVLPGILAVKIELYDDDFFSADDRHAVIANSVENTGSKK